MRVLGYSFQQPADAWRARETITERYGLPPSDAQLADLAGDGVVLGVRTPEGDVAEVARVLAEHGGRALVDVDERRTAPPGTRSDA